MAVARNRYGNVLSVPYVLLRISLSSDSATILRMFKKVLVLADGDDPRQPALRRAVECVAGGGQIEILAVVYEPMLEGYLGNKEIYEPLRRRVLDERRERAAARARALERGGVQASSKAVWSHPMHEAVAAEVDAAGIDLVVAAPASLHQGGGAGVAGLTHGDWQVVTSSRAPLLIVKSDGHTPYRRIVAAVEHAEMQFVAALAGHQRNGDVQQSEAQCSGPDRARSHGNLLIRLAVVRSAGVLVTPSADRSPSMYDASSQQAT